ncbi:MAG: hypothetical protein NWF03_08805 [Candidatus Bathyarchaeota archaeon]|nr:hypothetical protein [Candidatus Bathyarchaeota archaeon]
MIIFGSILIALGIVFNVYGNTLTANTIQPSGLVSGLYLFIVGVFCLISGVLVLASQVFPRKSVLYY